MGNEIENNRFEIQREEFLKGLDLIQGVSGRKTTIPILSHVLMEWDNKRLYLTGTDLETTIREELEGQAQTQSPGSEKASVPAKKLYEVVKALPDGTIHIEKKENHWIKLQCGKSTFNIAGLDPEEFPAIPSYASNQFSPIPTQMLLDMIKKTIYAAAADEARRYLNGVLWIQKETGGQKRIRMVASDGHRLSLVEKEGPTVTGMEKGVILPRKGLLELRMVMAEKDGAEATEVFIDPLYVFFEIGKSLVVIRRIDGEFPDYEQVMSSNSDKRLVVNREDFYNSLKRVSTMAASRKLEGIKLSVENDRMEIFHANQDFGDAREDLDVTYSGTPFEISFNASYLMDAMMVMDQDKIMMEIKDDGSPAFFKPVLTEENSAHISVVMPLRI